MMIDMKNLKNIIRRWSASALAVLALLPASCNKYLDIAPDDGMATLEMVFNMRSTAIKYLYSCYSFLPYEGHAGSPAMLGGDEFWFREQVLNSPSTYSLNSSAVQAIHLARGEQNVTSPYNYDWNSLYQGIRYCNTLADNILSVPDMTEVEKKQWIGEAKVLKAYFLFWLVRKWGPVPIVRENFDVSDGIETVRVFRDNVDDCFDYMIELIDEAMPDLELMEAGDEELGRINRVVAAAIKAKIAVTAASPLFNNNAEQFTLVDSRGVQLFPSKTEAQVKQRWEAAMTACKEAIDLCHEVGKGLYYYDGAIRADEHIIQELTLREALCSSWNKECVWGNAQYYVSGSGNKAATSHLTFLSTPNLDPETYPSFLHMRGWDSFGIALKIADQFYTKHGLPVENDKERADVDPYELRTIADVPEERWYMQAGLQTAQFNFDREPRFYADLGFDTCLWFGPNMSNPTPSNLYKINRTSLTANTPWITGYMCKKWSKYDTRVMSNSTYSISPWIWPNIRLADLYLLYAEAINEAEGPSGAHSEEMFHYLDAVRSRAGIPGVKDAWETYSNSPGKWQTQIGMRDIIHRERLIELAFEGQRFWDLRRWKEAREEYQKGFFRWNTDQPGTAAKYYKKTSLVFQNFTLKDYFWPLSTATLENNPNLIQNLGW